MVATAQELIQAREMTGRLLREIGLAAYLFEVEPVESGFELKIECACGKDGEWATVQLEIPREDLINAQSPAQFSRMLASLSARLNSCMRRQSESGLIPNLGNPV